MMRLPLVSPVERALFLRAQPYLDGLPSRVLTALASYTEEARYRAGERIRAPGDRIERILFLADGSVDIDGPPDVEGPQMRIAAPGAVGLAHHFAGWRHTPAVHAAQESLVLEITTGDLDQILEDHFPLVHAMTKTSCEQAVMAIKALGDARSAEPGFKADDRRVTPRSLDLVQRLSWAKRAPFFRDVNLTVLAALTGAEEPRMLNEGEVLWKEGDPVEGLALVLDGCLHSEGAYGSGRASDGAVIGAAELLAGPARFETWIADTPGRVLHIPVDLFVDFLEDHFEFAQAYLRRLSEDLVTSWDALSRAGERDRVRGFAIERDAL